MAKIVTLDLLRSFLEQLKKNFVASKAKKADMPKGFLGQKDTAEWGTQDGSCITNWYTDTGANIAFRDTGGNVNVVTSGHFYSNNGNNLVLDAGNYIKFLPVGDDSDAKEGKQKTWNISISGAATKADEADHAKNADLADKAVNDDLGRKISDTYVSMAGGAINGDLHVTGDVYASRVHNAIYNDYAEFFEKGEDGIQPGDIVALDESSDKEQYIKATKSSNVIVGICSDEYGHIIGGTPSRLINDMHYVPVALMGRVHAKVTGYVKPGDKIVISDTLPGVGMADDGTGKQVLGVALTKRKDGKVRMLVNRG